MNSELGHEDPWNDPIARRNFVMHFPSVDSALPGPKLLLSRMKSRGQGRSYDGAVHAFKSINHSSGPVKA
jgi:hypothetical protein